jgi:hypothetical protein
MDHIPNLWNRKWVGNIVRFNNKLSFMKSVTTVIVPFFIGIANDGEVFKGSNDHQSYNFLSLLQFLFHWIRNSLCTRMNWFTIRIHQLETNCFIVPCLILLMFHQKDIHIFGVIFWVDAVPLHERSLMSWWHHLSLLVGTQHQEIGSSKIFNSDSLWLICTHINLNQSLYWS